MYAAPDEDEEEARPTARYDVLGASHSASLLRFADAKHAHRARDFEPKTLEEEATLLRARKVALEDETAALRARLALARGSRRGHQQARDQQATLAGTMGTSKHASERPHATFLETYRQPITARTILINGEANGKIFNR